MQTVCGTQVSSGRAILETSQDEGGGGGEVSRNHTVVMDNGWGGPVVANKVLRESYGKLGGGGGSQEYYKPIAGNQVNFISTQPKSFTPPPPSNKQ